MIYSEVVCANVWVCDSHIAGCSEYCDEVLRYTDIANCWNIRTAAGN